jgi:hypothetical protein
MAGTLQDDKVGVLGQDGKAVFLPRKMSHLHFRVELWECSALPLNCSKYQLSERTHNVPLNHSAMPKWHRKGQACFIAF